MTRHNIHLLVIDPQNDFCDLPAEWWPLDPLPLLTTQDTPPVAPALPVPGAHMDMLRLANMMKRGESGLTNITVTLDSHHHVGVERPALWRNADGSPVAPYTVIRYVDLLQGRFITVNPALMARMLAYTAALEAAGRYELRIWPVHCETGSWGHNVHSAVRDAYNGWEERRLAFVSKVLKGTNPWTEHYSALKAEVPDANDHATELNVPLLQSIERSDVVLLAGEAGSHCFKSTVEHIIEYAGEAFASKLVILTDCVSPVPGYEAQYAEFLAKMKALGVQMATSDGYVGELVANGR